jgi:hypothetical protein
MHGSTYTCFVTEWGLQLWPFLYDQKLSTKVVEPAKAAADAKKTAAGESNSVQKPMSRFCARLAPPTDKPNKVK